MGSSVPIVLQKSPTSIRSVIMGNNRIGRSGFLNQSCALAPDVESTLLALALKIVLQQYLPFSELCAAKKLFGGVLVQAGALLINHIAPRRRTLTPSA